MGSEMCIRDSNDGIPDEYELGCDFATASNTNIELAIGSQRIEGQFNLDGLASAEYTIDLSDAAQALVASRISDGTGVNWIFDDDTQPTFRQTITVSPNTGAVLNTLEFGPNVTGNQNSIGDNNAQSIALTWSPTVNAIVHDPDNQLDVADGSILNSGKLSGNASQHSAKNNSVEPLSVG